MKPLVAGQQAPDFSSVDVTGQPVSLGDYSQGYVLLAFLRYAGCPWCNLAVHRLTLESKLLGESDCKVVTFIQSRKENIIENIHNRHAVTPVFPIIADPEKRIYEQYGVGGSVIQGVTQAIKDIPAWLHAVSKQGFKQGAIDGDLLLVPAMYLVDARTKQIVCALQNKSFYEHETFTPIYEALVFKDE